jgi:hypothetical protein
MLLEPAQTSAAFTPAISEPTRQRSPVQFPPLRPYVRSSGTPIFNDSDPLTKYLVAAAAQRRQRRTIEGQIEDRLRELRVDAQLEGEPFSEESVVDLRQFIQSVGVTNGPAIFLMDNGNIRTLWRDADGQQVGLQVLGTRRVQFVIFSQRENPKMMMRAYGIDSLVEINARLIHDRVDRLLAR